MRTIATILMLTGCGEPSLQDPLSSMTPTQSPPPSMFLFTSDLIPGQPFTIEVSGAVPGSPVGVGATTAGTSTDATCPPPLGGLCLDLINPHLIAHGTADAAGGITLHLQAPRSLPVGATVYLQAASAAGTASRVSYVWQATVFDTGCPQTLADFWAETASIRACTAPSQCGTVLSGTSCGCTRDWVARLGVSTTRFYQLQADAFACGLELISTCDCPAVSGYDCVSDVCTWDYTP